MTIEERLDELERLVARTLSILVIDESLNLEKLEENAIRAALRASNGNKKRAAQLLGIQRTTLYAKLKKNSFIV